MLEGASAETGSSGGWRLRVVEVQEGGDSGVEAQEGGGSGVEVQEGGGSEESGRPYS